MEEGIDNGETSQGVAHENLIRGRTIERVDMGHQLVTDEGEEFFTTTGAAESGAVHPGLMGGAGGGEIADAIGIGYGHDDEFREVQWAPGFAEEPDHGGNRADMGFAVQQIEHRVPARVEPGIAVAGREGDMYAPVFTQDP